MSNKEKYNKKDSSQAALRASEVGRNVGVRIVTWKTGIQKPAFWVQSKGLHAGRPLEKPIANCWAVYTDISYLKAIAYSLYISGQLRTSIIGSVVPFLRLSDYRPIITKAAGLALAYDTKHLQTLDFLCLQIESFETKLELFKEFQSLLAYKVNSELQIF